MGRLNPGVRGYDRRVEGLAEDRCRGVRRLRPGAGVGLVAAAGYALTVEDPHRLRRSRQAVRPVEGGRIRRKTN